MATGELRPGGADRARGAVWAGRTRRAVGALAPFAPRGPVGSWPAAKSAARSAPLRTFADVTELAPRSEFLTALLLICALPTLLRGSVIAA